MTDHDPVDVLANIESALSSPKVDNLMLLQYLALRQQTLNFNPDRAHVSFFATVNNDSVELEHVLSRMGNVYSVLSPFSAIPDYVANQGVISLILNKESGTLDGT
jgi:hypothetical protein